MFVRARVVELELERWNWFVIELNLVVVVYVIEGELQSNGILMVEECGQEMIVYVTTVEVNEEGVVCMEKSLVGVRTMGRLCCKRFGPLEIVVVVDEAVVVVIVPAGAAPITYAGLLAIFVAVGIIAVVAAEGNEIAVDRPNVPKDVRLQLMADVVI